MSLYVEDGYVESGYVEGDTVQKFETVVSLKQDGSDVAVSTVAGERYIIEAPIDGLESFIVRADYDKNEEDIVFVLLDKNKDAYIDFSTNKNVVADDEYVIVEFLDNKKSYTTLDFSEGIELRNETGVSKQFYIEVLSYDDYSEIYENGNSEYVRTGFNAVLSGGAMPPKKEKINFIVNTTKRSYDDVFDMIASLDTQESEEKFLVFGEKATYLATKYVDSPPVLEEISNKTEINYDEIAKIVSSNETLLSNVASAAKDRLTSDDNFKNNISTQAKNNLIADDDFKTSVASSVAQAILADTEFKKSVVSSMSMNIVTQTGEEIPIEFTWDETKNAFTMNYDTSNLDGTNYTIELTV